jgi:hypothetical protein
MAFSASPVRRRFASFWACALVVSALLCFGASYLASHYGQATSDDSQLGTASVQRIVQQATATAAAKPAEVWPLFKFRVALILAIC